MDGLPWYPYSAYLRARFGREVRRVSVDAGFGCPHRLAVDDGCGRLHRLAGRGPGGCTFCGEAGSRSPAAAPAGAFPSLREQVAVAAERLLRARPGVGLVLYLQAFSCTNAPVGELAAVYGECLSAAEFVGFAVGTRPDCVDAEKARLLASFATPGREVWVELGLQTAHDSTLALVRRGHTAADFARAFGMLRSAGVKVCVHLVLGLPGETASHVAATAEFVARLDPDAVKLHDLHICRGAALYAEYLAGEVTAPVPERYRDYVISVLERLPARTAVMRLTTDTPAAERAAPRRPWPRERFARELAAEMTRRGTRQGRLAPPQGPLAPP